MNLPDIMPSNLIDSKDYIVLVIEMSNIFCLHGLNIIVTSAKTALVKRSAPHSDRFRSLPHSQFSRKYVLVGSSLILYTKNVAFSIT